MKRKLPLGRFDIEMKVRVAGSPQRIWKAFVGETMKWWPPRMSVNAQAKRIVIEPRLGGKVWEDWGQGAGLVWWMVVGIKPGSWLELSGTLPPEMGGPATSIARFLLKPAGGGTDVYVIDHIYGGVARGADRPVKKGWTAILAALKAYVERKK